MEQRGTSRYGLIASDPQEVARSNGTLGRRYLLKSGASSDTHIATLLVHATSRFTMLVNCFQGRTSTTVVAALLSTRIAGADYDAISRRGTKAKEMSGKRFKTVATNVRCLLLVIRASPWHLA